MARTVPRGRALHLPIPALTTIRTEHIIWSLLAQPGGVTGERAGAARPGPVQAGGSTAPRPRWHAASRRL